MRPLIDQQTQAHLDRISDLSMCCGNPDHLSAENAARALNEGKPAYWFKGRFSASALVVSAAGYEGSLTRTMIAYIDQDNEKVRNGLKSASDIDAVLDGIIPLNDAAVEELALLYRYQSTFRDDLAGRERQAIYNPWFIKGMDLATRAVWEVRYAACQRRFEERRLNALPDANHPALALVLAAAQVEVA